VSRAPTQRVEHAAQALLSDGERVTSTGSCWAVQVRPKVPLLLLARRKYIVALTDRRVLVFARRRRGPEASDLVIAKRYETFTLEHVRRRRPLLQVALGVTNGNRLVFEFRRRERELAGELIARLTPPPAPAPMTPIDTLRDAPWSAPATSEERADAAHDPAFWGAEP